MLLWNLPSKYYGKNVSVLINTLCLTVFAMTVLVHVEPPEWVKHVLKAFLVTIFIICAPANGTAVLNIIVCNRMLRPTNTLTRHNRVCKQSPKTLTACPHRPSFCYEYFQFHRSYRNAEEWDGKLLYTKQNFPSSLYAITYLCSTPTLHKYVRSLFLQWLVSSYCFLRHDAV